MSNSDGRRKKRRTQLLRQLGNHYSDLPIEVRGLALLDDAQYSDSTLTAEMVRRKRIGGRSFADVYRTLQGGMNVSIFGGTKLGSGPMRAQNDPLFKFNQRLGEIFASLPRPDGAIGWNIVTGGGPGLAMKGPLFCLGQATSKVSGSISRRVAVTSSLEGETPHEYIDEETKVRPQPETFLRERMIMYLGWDGFLVYPGYWGTIYELFAVGFDIYCQGRDVVSSIARFQSHGSDLTRRSPYPGPLILIDRQLPQRKRKHDERVPQYWDPVDTLHAHASDVGVAKADAPVEFHVILDTDPQGPEKVASLILDHAARRRSMPIRDTIRVNGSK